MRCIVFVALLAACSNDRLDAVEQHASGSLTDSARSTTWTAGPFAVPNPTGTAGAPICNAVTPCSDFALSVAVPAGYDASHDLVIAVRWAQSAADFDVYVLDASGAIVRTSASSADPEQVTLPAASGTYTVRVVPFAPLGQSITGTATLADRPVAPPPSTDPAPTYAVSSAPDALRGAHAAGEPSIGVNPRTAAVLFQAGLSTFRVTYDAAGAATWVDASARPPACTAATSLDPILFTERATGRTFESQLAGKASLTCFTDNDGASWLPVAETGINSGVDHQTIGGGPSILYYCSQDIGMAQCATSTNGGLAFGPAVPMYTLFECGGLHGHVKLAPDGTAYVPNKSCGGNQAVVVSTDNGLTWAVRKHPGSTPGDSDPSVGVGAGGTIYLGYHNSDGTAHVAVSRDRGVTWTNDQNVGAALGIKNIVFPAVVAGDDNRAAFAFIGTTTGGNYQDAANFHGDWHLYVATTYDGGASWVTADATPNDPVQRGSICTAGTTCGNDRNLLDFIDVTIDARGRVLVAFADGCTGACAAPGGAQNADALAAIARQASGRGLLAAFDAP